MHSLTCSHIDDVLVSYTNIIKESNSTISPRGLETKEIFPACFTLTDPLNGICTFKNRKLLYRLVAAEFLMYVCGYGNETSHADFLVRVAPNMANFRNPDTHLFDGAYGPQISASLRNIVFLLAKDSDTRQAYLPIFDKDDCSRAYRESSRDIRCTEGFQFLIRDKKLHMITNMRSNDLYWGTPYDVAAFTLIQRLIAHCLELELGTYTHTAGSLHYYITKEDNVYSGYSSSGSKILLKNILFEDAPRDFDTLISELRITLDMAILYYETNKQNIVSTAMLKAANSFSLLSKTLWAYLLNDAITE